MMHRTDLGPLLTVVYLGVILIGLVVVSQACWRWVTE